MVCREKSSSGSSDWVGEKHEIYPEEAIFLWLIFTELGDMAPQPPDPLLRRLHVYLQFNFQDYAVIL